MAKGSSTGVVTGQDIINDPLAALLFKTLTSRTQGNLMYEQAYGGSAVALARIPKNIRCQKDSKKNMTPPRESRISIRTPDQEVGLIHPRATERLETHGQSPLQRGPSFVNALKNIQHTLNPALRPLMNTSTLSSPHDRSPNRPPITATQNRFRRASARSLGNGQTKAQVPSPSS